MSNGGVPLCRLIAVLGVAVLAPDLLARGGLRRAVPFEAWIEARVDVARALSAYRELDVVEMARDEEVAGFVAPALAIHGSEIAAARAVCTLLGMYGVPAILKGELLVALAPPEAGTGRVSFLVLSETTGPEAALASLSRALELPTPEWEETPVSGESSASPHRRVLLHGVAGVGDLSLDHGAVGDVVVLSDRADWFEAAARALAEGGDGRGEPDTALLERATGIDDPVVEILARPRLGPGGWAAVRLVAYRAAVVDGALSEEFFAAPLEPAGLVPIAVPSQPAADGALASVAVGLDLDRLLFSDGTVVPSGGVFGPGVALAIGDPGPGRLHAPAALAVGVRDADAALGRVESLIETVARASGARRADTTPRVPGALWTAAYTLPPPAGPETSLTVALLPDRLVLATDERALLAYGVGLVPPVPGGDTLVTVRADLARAVQRALSALEPVLPTFVRRSGLPLDPSAVPLPDTLASYLGSYTLSARRLDDGVLVTAESAIGGPLLAVPLVFLAEARSTRGGRSRLWTGGEH